MAAVMFSARWKSFRDRVTRSFSSPIVSVSILVVVMVGGFACVRALLPNDSAAQLKFVELPQKEKLPAADNTSLEPRSEIFYGDVYESTICLREAAALGMAVSLTVFAEYAEKRAVPSTAEVVLNSLYGRNLLPPGIRTEQGVAISDVSRYRLRYQAAPLRFEILSTPVRPEQPYSLLLRFPLPASSSGTVTYFRSSPDRALQIPNPFSSPDQLVGLGWTIEQWHGDVLAIDENTKTALREQSDWLRSQR